MSPSALVSPGVDTEEQAALRDSIRSALTRHADSAAMRAAISSEKRYDNALWTTLCEQVGVAALAVPEEFGGVGATLTELYVALEEVGRALAPVPLFGSAVLATQALLLTGDHDVCQAHVPGLADGSTIGALCWADESGWGSTGVTADGGVLDGTAHYVLDAELADLLIVLVDSGGTTMLYVVPSSSDGVTITPNPVLDPTRPLATVSFDQVSATPVATGPGFRNSLLRVTESALTADQVGGARAVLEATVDYTQSRTQFGRAIGSFQALKHRMADMYARTETMHSIGYAAIDAVVSDAANADELVAAAAMWCGEGYFEIAADAVQLHGGIGITWECDVQLYFKRAQSDSLLLRQPHQLIETLATAAGLRG